MSLNRSPELLASCFMFVFTMSLWALMILVAWPIGTPGGWLAGFIIGDHQTLLHTKYISCEPHGFRRRYFRSFFTIVSMYEPLIPGVWPVLTLGA